jgi:hypothetical protein
MIEKRLWLLGWLSEELTEHDEKYYRKWAHETPPLRHSKRGTIVDIHTLMTANNHKEYWTLLTKLAKQTGFE